MPFDSSPAALLPGPCGPGSVNSIRDSESDRAEQGGQVVDALAHGAAVVLQHPSRDALHPDALRGSQPQQSSAVLVSVTAG